MDLSRDFVVLRSFRSLVQQALGVSVVILERDSTLENGDDTLQFIFSTDLDIDEV